jgi:surfeit locus 1 family protein
LIADHGLSKLGAVPGILRSPRWWLGHLLALTLVALFVSLGLWQLRRLDERRIDNLVRQSRLADAVYPIEELVAAVGGEMASLEYRRTTATGVFDVDSEVLVRSQVLDGVAGFHVVTPLVLANGSAVLVNRGWVPLDFGQLENPGDDIVEVRGWIRVSQQPTSTGPAEREGTLTEVARVNIERLAEQMEYPLLAVYIVAEDGAQTPPIPLELPDLSDEGPHLSYAIQWFAFAIIGLTGYGLLLRRAAQRPRPAESEALDDLDSGKGSQD